MQATTRESPSPSPSPSELPLNPATIVITNADGTQQRLAVPMNASELRALKSQRNELSNQLVSAANRRHELAQELKTTPAGPSRTGLESRIEVLDKRIVQLESDIATTGRQLSAAPLDVQGAADGGSGGDMPDNVAAISGAFIALILFPLTLVFVRNLWKRGTRRSEAAPPQLAGDAGRRLERLEHGVDAIAIEIERVAEGQRFVTRLLSENGAAQSVSINRSMERESTS